MAVEKVTRAVEAAAETFLRYGFARTTMGDIAKAGGMSRPALYLLFAGKEQLFAAATSLLADRRLEETRHVLQSCEGVRQKLTTAIEMLLVSFFEIQQAAPDARDMDDLSFPVVREIYARFEKLLAEVIAEGATNPVASPDQIARVLLYGARGYREVSANTDEFRKLVQTQVALLGGQSA